MEWSSERIEQLRSLWQNGLSASQIAHNLGGITRNAVIGKAHRLGLTGRPSPIKNRPSGISRPRPPLKRPLVEEPVPPSQAIVAPPPQVIAAAPPPRIEPPRPVVDVDSGPGASILTLTDRICKWPIGDPRQPGFHFCGRASSEGLPYCAEHARRAYQPPARRSSDREDEVSRVTVRR